MILPMSLTCGPGASLVATTQAAEKVYRAGGPPAQLAVTLARRSRRAGCSGCRRRRSSLTARRSTAPSTADIAADARLLIVESLVLGRTEMGERDISASFSRSLADQSRRPVGLCRRLPLRRMPARGPAALGERAGLRDAFFWSRLTRRSIWRRCAKRLGDGAGVSAWHGKLVARLLATDGFNLRKRLIPAVRRLLPEGELPRIWSL